MRTHQITLQQAIDMTTLYRTNRPDNFPVCESFEKAAIASLISHPGCAWFRIYYGMKPDMVVHAILVAADVEGRDILPSAASSLQDEGEILEDSLRCPVTCPPPSPLNGE